MLDQIIYPYAAFCAQWLYPKTGSGTAKTKMTGRGASSEGSARSLLKIRDAAERSSKAVVSSAPPRLLCGCRCLLDALMHMPSASTDLNIMNHLLRDKAHQDMTFDGKTMQEVFKSVRDVQDQAKQAHKENVREQKALRAEGKGRGQGKRPSEREAGESSAMGAARAPASTTHASSRAPTPQRTGTGFTPLPQTPPPRGSKSPSTTPGGTRKL